MKKTYTFTLLFMFIFLLTACGDQPPKETEDTEDTVEDTTVDEDAKNADDGPKDDVKADLPLEADDETVAETPAEHTSSEDAIEMNDQQLEANRVQLTNDYTLLLVDEQFITEELDNGLIIQANNSEQTFIELRILTDEEQLPTSESIEERLGTYGSPYHVNPGAVSEPFYKDSELHIMVKTDNLVKTHWIKELEEGIFLYAVEHSVNDHSEIQEVMLEMLKTIDHVEDNKSPVDENVDQTA